MYGTPYDTITFTIASGQTTSGGKDIGFYTWFALQFPAAMTGTGVSFQASPDGENWATLQNEAGAVSVTPAAGAIVALESASPTLAPIRFLRLVSNASEAADRELVLHCKAGVPLAAGGGGA